MRVTLLRPHAAHIDTALADQAVVKLMRGPTCEIHQHWHSSHAESGMHEHGMHAHAPIAAYR